MFEDIKENQEQGSCEDALTTLNVKIVNILNNYELFKNIHEKHPDLFYILETVIQEREDETVKKEIILTGHHLIDDEFRTVASMDIVSEDTPLNGHCRVTREDFEKLEDIASQQLLSEDISEETEDTIY